MSGEALAARGVERRFGATVALAGVDLDVEPGEVVYLCGPNGAGKTTLLRILARLLRPTAGQVKVLGHDLRQAAEGALRALGFLSHEPALYLDLTPRENLEFTAALHGLDAPAARAGQALAGVGLSDRDLPVRMLSRGQQQRAAIARALLHSPRVLLLDEPWTGLDPDAQRLLLGIVARHRAAGGAAVITTHDLAQGLGAATRVVLLARGRVWKQAPAGGLALAELEADYSRAAAEA